MKMVKVKSSSKKSIKDTMIDAISEFYEGVMFPYMDGRFTSIEDRLENVEVDVKDLKEDMDDVQRKLYQNQKDHDEMFVRFDRIENKVDGHERRIKKIEKSLQTS